jgi:Fur family transcriptional regulator, ferric uptake regulator
MIMEIIFNKGKIDMPRKKEISNSQVWHGKFKGRGYSMTVPRKAMIEVLHKTNKHLSAEEVYTEIHRIYPQIGLTTVYRTLELLEELGLVLRFDLGDRRSRYEPVDGPEEDHHHHLICTRCAKVINYSEFMKEELEFIKKAKKDLSRKYNFYITNHVVNFYGLCDRCRSRG